MAHNEAARETGEPIVVSNSPDVCLTPMGSGMVPVPYSIVAYLESTVATTPSVVFTEDPVFTTVSDMIGVQGDEAGTGAGVASGSHAGGAYTYVLPGSHAPNVFSEGNQIVYHSSQMCMNAPAPHGPYNTIGTLLWMESSRTVEVDEDGEVEGETDPDAVPETAAEAAAGDEGMRWQATQGHGYNATGDSFSQNYLGQTYGTAHPNATAPDGMGSPFGIGGTGDSFQASVFDTGGQDSYLRALTAQGQYNLGYSYDPGAQSHLFGGGAGVTGSFLDGQYTLGPMVGRGQVLTGSAQAQAHAFTGATGTGLRGQAALEADLVRGNLGFAPQTVTVQDVLNGYFDMLPDWMGNPQAPEWTDVGVVVGAEIEAGIGAGAAAEGEVRVGNGFQGSGRLSLGLGPKVGVRGTAGLHLGDGFTDAVSGAYSGARDTVSGWFDSLRTTPNPANLRGRNLRAWQLRNGG